MTSRELKELLSRLTGVQLVRQGMADVPGVRNIKNREGLKWEEFSQGQTDVPPTVSKELSNLMADFQNNFNAFSGGDKHVRMIWAYVTKDAAIQQAHINAIEESDDPKKDQFKELINWMDKYGARLWMSPSAIDRHIQSTGQKVKHSSNTSMKWLEQFGYIWGLGKKGDYRDRRDAHDLSDEHVEKLKNDPASREQFDASGQELMKVVTAQKNGAYGIFFTPDDGFNLTPVIGTDYYKASNTDENNSEWVNWDHFRSESGQHSKYFGISQKQPNGDVKKMFVYPTSTQFFWFFNFFIKLYLFFFYFIICFLWSFFFNIRGYYFYLFFFSFFILFFS
jgi:hypothetical protein